MATHGHTRNAHALNAAKKVKKRLCVFCDGTWQDGVNKTRPLTNVGTLARCLAPIDGDGCLQLVYYDSGVGTSASRLAQLIDGATGRGISAKIRNAYSFLSHNYNFGRPGDEIALVGFSRGAFTVQCLASFLSDAGLLQRQHLYYLRGLFTLWSLQKVPGGETTFKNERNRLLLSGVLHPVSITACAVWDTVSSLGSKIRLWSPPRPLSFVGRTVPSGVKNAFQALALDETRRDFRPVLWEELEPKRDEDVDRTVQHVSQCWFLGTHSDVGGNGDAALGALTLLWMVGKLSSRVGVLFDEDEIAKHLKHKFLEWDFEVSTGIFGTKFKEKRRTLSTMEHSGQSTPLSWYWRLLGRESRARYLHLAHSLSNEIHFTVRLTMAKGTNSSKPLREWQTSWRSQTDQTPARIQWHNSSQRQAGTGHDGGDGVAWEMTPGGRTTSNALYEHNLDLDGEEFILFNKWAKGTFPPKPTDRTGFAKLQLEVQEPGSNTALDSLAKLLKAYMEFDEDERLAPEMLYDPGPL
ncbi:hypothetical protein B0T24DRAFT_109245 [Lasiosphaeria ovina]|uniref:T6SS Phospholipase effector Tle1-like catalytic domain-containing protein n=1 Tax=Lasiosphaeria ovina TaxID=92902 RepID=A0AAE0JTC8_9PEZI|nr:hypothetical protein B0T24DRAFT_109245 [Lasiosphaeria ovina]